MYQGPGKYRHFKGNVYDVIGEGIHTETRETVVVYRDGGGTIFVRPLTNFNSRAYDEAGIISKQRFIKLG